MQHDVPGSMSTVTHRVTGVLIGIRLQWVESSIKIVCRYDLAAARLRFSLQMRKVQALSDAHLRDFGVGSSDNERKIAIASQETPMII